MISLKKNLSNEFRRILAAILIVAILLPSIPKSTAQSFAGTISDNASQLVSNKINLSSCITEAVSGRVTANNDLANHGIEGCLIDLTYYPSVIVRVYNKHGVWKKITVPYNLNDDLVEGVNIWGKYGYVAPNSFAEYRLTFDTKYDANIQFFVNAGAEGNFPTIAGGLNIFFAILEALGAVTERFDLDTLEIIAELLESQTSIMLASDRLMNNDWWGFIQEFNKIFDDDEVFEAVKLVAARVGITITKESWKTLFTPFKIYETGKHVFEVAWITITGRFAGTAVFINKVTDNPLPPSPIPPISDPSPLPSLDQAKFTGLEYPNDDYIGSPNSQVEKRWQIRNTGSSTWHSGYRLFFVSGHQMGALNEIAIPIIQPNQTLDLKINITVPSGAGVYRGNWRLRNPQGTLFGDELWVQVTVPSTNAPPSGGQAIDLSCSNCPVTVTPGQQFRPTIQAKVNSGQLQGTNLRGDMLRHKSGDRFGAWEFVAVEGSTVVNPGQSYNFTFYENNPITAPSNPGVYESTWQIWRSGGWDGPEYTIRFEVVASGESNQRPNRPQLNSPHDWYVYYSGNTATLCGQQMGDPDGDAISAYYFEIYDSAQNWNSGWTGSSCVTTGGLGPYGYKWRMKVRDSRVLESEWSESWHFTLVNPNLSIKELYFQPQDNNERVKIRACTEGQGGVGITLRTSVNDANDGSGNGTWRILHELGVPCYNEQDAPIWTTLDYDSGPHRVRVEARGSGSGWDGAAVREEVYNIPTNLRPNHPSGQEPQNNAYLNSQTVSFKWKATWRTTSYRLEAFDNEQYTGTPLLDVQVSAGTTEYTHTFQGNSLLVFWRVTASGPYGSHSSTQRFYIDTVPPTSNVETLSAKVTETPFQVTWGGTDNVSGIRWYQIQVKEGTRADSQWVDWLVNTAETSALFHGEPGESYAFRSSAMDQVGNWESWHVGSGDTQTTVDLSTAPSGSVADLVVQSLQRYPLSQDSQAIQAVVQNVGTRSTENSFYIDLYADRLPTGPGDYTGSIQFWLNNSIEPGTVVTLTTVVTRASSLLSAAATNGTGETSVTLYAQVDSAGVIKESSKSNNIYKDGLTLCFASSDPYEDNDSAANATVLNLAQAQQHNLAAVGDEDWFEFVITTPGTYLMRTFDLGDTADTYLYLYEADGTTLLTSNDDDGDSLASHIQWEVSIPGAYYLRVRQWNPNLSGCGTNYSIEVDKQVGMQIYLPAVNRNASGGGPITNPVATVTPTSTPTPTPTPTPHRDVLAFASGRDGNWNIYKAYSDGSGLTRLTSGSSFKWGPSWHPDGSRIAYVSEQDGDQEIYVMKADGTGVQQLTYNDMYDSAPSWSPDGAKLAYKRFINGWHYVYIMNADGTNSQLINMYGGNDWRIAWSPNGNRLAITLWIDGNNEIHLVNIDGSNLVRITNNSASDNDVDWSPDGTKLAFVSDRDGDPEIYVMNIDGTGLTQLTYNQASDSIPEWSPDGSKIAFVSDRNGYQTIFIMNSDGTQQRKLLPNDWYDTFPSWRH